MIRAQEFTMKVYPHINTNVQQGVAHGNALAALAHTNIGPDLPHQVSGPVIIEVLPSNSTDRTALLVNIVTEEIVTEEEFTTAGLIHWVEDNRHFIRKNKAGGPVGYVTAEVFAAVMAELTQGAEQVPEMAVPSEEVPSQSDDGVGVPPTQVITAVAASPEPEDEAVVQLAVPAAPTGPYLRKDDGSPFDLNTSRASYVFYHADANTTVVVRNRFSSRRTPYKVRPTIASNEIALAKRLHGKPAEVEARVRATVTRTGPRRPLRPGPRWPPRLRCSPTCSRN